MKSRPGVWAVQVGKRVEEFSNEEAARRYASRWGVVVLAANIDTTGSSDQMPVISPGLVQSLGLRPQSISEPKEVHCAWEANERQVATRHPNRIIAALTDFWRARWGLDTAKTLVRLKQRHPTLFNTSLRHASA